MKIANILTVGLALALAVVLGGAGVSYALWTSQATASGSVAAGAVGVSLAGGDSLAVTYSSSTLSQTGSVVVGNSGSVAAGYSTAVVLGAGSSAAFASATQVIAWSASAAGVCSAAPPPSAGTGTWSNIPAISGTLAPGASVTWCLKTTLTAAQASTYAGTQATAVLTVTAAIGSWTAASSTPVAQNVAASVPTVPSIVCTNTDPYNAQVSWSNIPGATYQTVYQVWVNGRLFSDNHNSGYTSLSIGWSKLVGGGFAQPDTTAQVEVRVKGTGSSTALIASGSVAAKVIQYPYYQAQVVQCS